MVSSFFFFKQKTAYEMRISDWSSDVCSYDLLMTPFSDPGPNPHGNPKIALAGVGEKMTEVAGEVCDGFLCHGFTTERYLREVTLPALERGAAKSGRTLADIEISGPAFVVTRSEEHTSELQSLMRISYAVFCLKKNTK